MELKSVLLVEDNEDLRGLAIELLSDDGFLVQPASSGEEVLRLLREGLFPDCILLDLGLPDMSPELFHAAFNEIPGAPGIPLALVSGNADLGNWAERFKASRVIRKPYGLNDILGVARELCFARAMGVACVASLSL